MHLVGPYLTTTSYKKRDFKMTKKKQAQLEADWLQHNKTAKSFGEPKLTFEEYWTFVVVSCLKLKFH